MQYTINRTCGHAETVSLEGPHAERKRKLAWMEQQPCRQCRNTTANQHAAHVAHAAGLPALLGSDKQVAWAMTLRGNVFAELDRRLAPFEGIAATAMADGVNTAEEVATARAEYDAIRAYLTGQMQAAWWIERRSKGFRALIAEVTEEVQATHK